jgi:hypothetical protein
MKPISWRAFAGGVIFASVMLGGATSYGASSCDSLITPAQAAAALGVPTVKGGAVDAKLCNWFVPTKNDPQGLEKNVEIAILGSKAYGAVSLMTSTATKQVEPVSGIGDGAVQVTSKMGTVLDVKKGDNYFSVSVMGLPVDQAKAAVQRLAKQILPKL